MHVSYKSFGGDKSDGFGTSILLGAGGGGSSICAWKLYIIYIYYIYSLSTTAHISLGNTPKKSVRIQRTPRKSRVMLLDDMYDSHVS